MTQKRAIGYRRVSTTEQGDSGAGLDRMDFGRSFA